MRAVDKHEKAATADDSPFTLVGGTYLFLAHINNASGLSAVVQMLCADGTNYVDVSSSLAHVDGRETLYLPPGQFRFAVTGSAGAGESFDLSLCRVPGE